LKKLGGAFKKKPHFQVSLKNAVFGSFREKVKNKIMFFFYQIGS
jgi:hypothetical protein